MVCQPDLHGYPPLDILLAIRGQVDPLELVVLALGLPCELRSGRSSAQQLNSGLVCLPNPSRLDTILIQPHVPVHDSQATQRSPTVP